MKKKIILFSACFLAAFGLSAQLTIDICQEKALENYPLIRQYNLIEKTEHYSISNANSGYIPQINIFGKASYQSEVTKIDLGNFNSIIDVPKLSKEQYQIMGEINQAIWDGGMTIARKKIARATTEVEKQQNEVNLFALKERVNNLYFGILLIDEQLELNKLMQNELNINYDKVSAYVENGVANESDLDVVQVEMLKTKQQETELINTQNSYKQMLSIMIGEEISPETTFKKPDYNELLMNISTENNRPELKMFDAQRDLLDIQISLIKWANLPTLSLFLQGGYGKPGLNMLGTKFEPFYVGGIKFTWNISGFYTQKNDSQKLEINCQTIDIQKETFLFNNELTFTEQNNTIKKFLSQLENNDEIIQLRTSIKKSSEIKVENGTMSVSDLMRDINAENLSKQEKSLNEIQLLMAIYNLKITRNN
jgi:outer membrane protein TolC